MKKIKVITNVLNARNRRQKREARIIAGLKTRLLAMIKSEMEAQDINCITLSKQGRFGLETVKKVINGEGNSSRLDIYFRMALALGIRPRVEFFDEDFEFKASLEDTRDDV